MIGVIAAHVSMGARNIEIPTKGNGAEAQRGVFLNLTTPKWFKKMYGTERNVAAKRQPTG